MSDLKNFINDLSLKEPGPNLNLMGFKFKNLELKLSEYNSLFNIKGKLLVSDDKLEILNASIYDELNVR